MPRKKISKKTPAKSKEKSGEKRRYGRYQTDVKIEFYVSFDLRTKVDYRVKEKDQKKFSDPYEGISKNVSVEGLCFTSERRLNQGDRLIINVFLPASDEPIHMDGEVRWCRASDQIKGTKRLFDTGVRIFTVNGDSVERSIFIDRIHKVAWSIVLESVFGGFKHLALKRKKLKKKSSS